MLSRVPVGPANQGMSSNAHLVLDVESFELVGAFGEPVWGKPKDIELNADIRTWVEGMRQGGGAG